MYSENLKKLRKELGLSVEKLSDKLGIPASTIWGYEGNKRTPSIEFPIQLYRVLNVNINWFLTGEGEMFINRSPYFSDNEFTNKVENILRKNNLIK